MRKKLISIGAVVLVLALLLTLAPSCGKKEGEVKTLKVGFIGPLSGLAAPWGVGSEQGAKWGADRFNAAGGIKVGDDRYMIEIVSCDTQYTGSVAADCATRLVFDEGIKYVIGPIGTWDAVDPIFNANKVIVITQATVCHPTPASPYMVAAVIPSWDWTNAYYKQATDYHPELKTIAVLAPDNMLGREFMDATLELAPHYGLTVVADKLYDTMVTDFYPVLTPIVAENPDAIDLGTGASPPGFTALLTKQVRELGYEGLLLQPGATDTSTLLEVAGPENVWGITSSFPGYSSEVYPARTRELYQDWLENYASPGETEIAITTGNSFKSMLFLKAAIEAADSIDVDEVIEAIEDPDFRFDIFAANDVPVGGLETFGIKRSFPHPIPYGEIIDADNVNLSMSVIIVHVP